MARRTKYSKNSTRGDDSHASRDKRGHDGNAGQGPQKRSKDETSKGKPLDTPDGEARRSKREEFKKHMAGGECYGRSPPAAAAAEAELL